MKSATPLSDKLSEFVADCGSSVSKHLNKEQRYV
jgi:hypothetical protein